MSAAEKRSGRNELSCWGPFVGSLMGTIRVRISSLVLDSVYWSQYVPTYVQSSEWNSRGKRWILFTAPFYKKAYNTFLSFLFFSLAYSE